MIKVFDDDLALRETAAILRSDRAGSGSRGDEEFAQRLRADILG